MNSLDQAQLATLKTLLDQRQAALARQESLFDPAATSSAGARGLMQVMPEVGKRVARGLGYPEWDAVLLYQADANLEIGSTHLRALLDT